MIGPPRLAPLAAVATVVFAAAAIARAQVPSDGLPVITEHREAEILALFKPFDLGKEITPGWQLADVGIQATRIEIKLAGPGKAAAGARLELPRRTPSAETTPSFSVIRDPGAPPDGAKALDALVDAVRKNDGGKFWPLAAPVPRVDDGSNAGRVNQPAAGAPGENDPGAPPLRQRLGRRLILGGTLLVILGILVFSRRNRERRENDGTE